MAITLTPAKARFFLYASFTRPGQEPQPTLLQQLLTFPIHPQLRYRLGVLRRNLESSLAPFDAQAKELYEAYMAAVADPEPEDEAASPAPEAKTRKRKPEAEPASETGTEPATDDPEDPEKAKARAQAKQKYEEDMAELNATEFQFTGKLIPASHLDGLPQESSAFFAIPGVMDEWFMPFVMDD